MVYKIKIPDELLEKIRESGIEKSRKNREVTGFLLGSYENGSILAERKLNYPSKIGDGNWYNNLHDDLILFLGAPRFLYNQIKISKYKIEKRKKGEQTGIIGFHSHQASSWSYDDLSFISPPVTHVQYAELLYRADINNFEAIDTTTKPIPIEIIDNSGKTIKTIEPIDD